MDSIKLPSHGKILALDLGSRRTGVAISDLSQKVAFARPELEHRSDIEALQKIKILIQNEGVVGCIAGLPLKLDGTRTEQTQKTELLITEVQKFIPVLKVDERLSTQFAKDLHGFETKETKWDSRSAQILLETYLDRTQEIWLP